ncbi:MAG: sulfite exporter TauE/SafE family protein [Gammaproteobacteria bacterium]|nr:sulfite exporter TauE/SafE family protein [Gammaproteobacteria bacterium]
MPSQHLYSLPTVFVLGLVFGMGPCTITCLPFLGPVFLAKHGGINQSWKIILPFSLGRLSSYSTLGIFSGLAGASIQQMLDNFWVACLLGGSTILVGLLIFYRSYRKSGCKGGKRIALQDHPLLPSGLFFMGVGMAATPCIPLTSVIVTAASTGSGLSGFFLGLCFGIGAVIVPALVFGMGMAYFSERIRQILFGWRTRLERASALLLIAMGIFTIGGAVG